MFFGDHEVLLTYRESIGRETVDALGHSRDHLRDNDFRPGSASDHFWDFARFQEKVEEYLSRHLPFDTDVLLAFTEVLEWISYDTQMPFMYATPRNDLLNGLL